MARQSRILVAGVPRWVQSGTRRDGQPHSQAVTIRPRVSPVLRHAYVQCMHALDSGSASLLQIARQVNDGAAPPAPVRVLSAHRYQPLLAKCWQIG